MLEQLKLDHKPIYIYLQSVSPGNVLSISMWPHPFSILKRKKEKYFAGGGGGGGGIEL